MLSPAARALSLLLVAGALVALAPRPAGADAVLARGGVDSFPTLVDIDVAVRAQVESTTYVLTFAPITEGGSDSLTVPSPVGAWPIGVDVDRGDGFESFTATGGTESTPSGSPTARRAPTRWAAAPGTASSSSTPMTWAPASRARSAWSSIAPARWPATRSSRRARPRR
jgi:hypothetical protein